MPHLDTITGLTYAIRQKVNPQIVMQYPIEKIAEYFADNKDVVAVYLFGSHAEGKERPMSDIDIGILLDSGLGSHLREERNRYMSDLSRLLRKDIHPVIINCAGEELMKQIFSRGKCIRVNDSGKHSHFRTVMFSRIAEFGYYKRQMQAGLAMKIMED